MYNPVWENFKRIGYIEIGGNQIDLSHLSDKIYQFTIEASGNYPEINASMLVQYGSHCVSWGPRHGEVIDFTVHGDERRIIDGNDIHRCFCENRYQWSKNLPNIFSTLVDRHCFFTGRQNWLTIEILDPSGEHLEYEVFFRITRQSTHMLRVYVESAYVRNSSHLRSRPMPRRRRDKVRAKVLLAKRLRGEALRPPP